MFRAAVLVACLLCTADVAAADRGVALSVGKLEVAQTLTAGAGYRLPPIGVRNPGNEVTSYRMLVSSVHDQQGKVVPADWVRFEPAELTLRPGVTREVQARLSLPSGADPGRYDALLAAQIETEGKGAQVGAAAAAKLTFSVRSSTLLGAWWYRVRTFASSNEPWTWLVPAFLAACLLGFGVRRRFSFQIARRA
jgi:hypothetical protein